ncbi:MAG: PEGA domain-containing protein [Helicobacteraceae bacterium]
MKKIALFVAFCATLFGSATIISGKMQMVSFNSEPSGASVYVNGMLLCQATPCQVQVQRPSDTSLFEFKKAGYKTTKVFAGKGLNKMVVANIVSAGVLGTSTDAATGALWEYQPSQFFVTLTKE